MARPVIVLGVAQRTGTNHLLDLLVRHPGCVAGRYDEDRLLMHADALESYVGRVLASPDHDDHRDAERTRALRELGAALLRLVTPEDADERRVVTKSPSTQHVQLVGHLWPDADLVLLVRDGRSVAESFVRATGWGSYTRVFGSWREGARRALAVLDDPASAGLSPDRVHLVRFEELVADGAGVLGALFERLDLPLPASEVAAIVADAPVIRSSFERGGRSMVHHQPLERPPDFDPTDRHGAWPARRQREFRAHAGAEAAALGYAVGPLGRSGPLQVLRRRLAPRLARALEVARRRRRH